MHEFRYSSYPQEIIFGAGALNGLGEAVDRFGWQRLLLCSTGSLRRGGQIARLEKTLGSRLAATYDAVQPHVPDYQVGEVLALARENSVNAIIGMGGGSAIGMAKAVSHALDGPANRSSSPLDWPRVPVVAIPTTYAGSELTPVYGVTHHDRAPARKITVTDPRVTPALALYDPLLTLDLPPDMTASTGINALAHCLEALYSVTRNPLSTAAARSGVRHITSALPRCYDHGQDLDARTEMLTGSMLAASALAHVAMALHHGICHVLGGTAGVGHGVANAIILPHALRFNLQATAPQLVEAAEAMGIPTANRSPEASVGEMIETIDALARRTNLPRRLRDVGVQEADLPRLAQLALESRAVQNNPRPVTGAAQVQEILEAAW